MAAFFVLWSMLEISCQSKIIIFFWAVEYEISTQSKICDIMFAGNEWPVINGKTFWSEIKTEFFGLIISQLQDYVSCPSSLQGLCISSHHVQGFCFIHIMFARGPMLQICKTLWLIPIMFARAFNHILHIRKGSMPHVCKALNFIPCV